MRPINVTGRTQNPILSATKAEPPSCYVCIRHCRSDAVDATEENLSLALVAIVGRNRPMVAADDVRAQLEGFYHLQPDEFTVSTYAPEDFMVRFASA